MTVEERLDQLQNSLSELWSRVTDLEHEVNNTIKNDAGNVSQSVDGHTVDIASLNTAVDDIVIAMLEEDT